MKSRIRNTAGNSRHGPPPKDDLPLGHTGPHHHDVEPQRDDAGSPARRRVGDDPFGHPAPKDPNAAQRAALSYMAYAEHRLR